MGRGTVSSARLRVAIVGGGIGGVAAANALLQRGIDVRVFEQAGVLTEIGAGLALQPNGVRMLRRLGFGDDLLRWGARWRDPQYRRSDGTLIAPMWPADIAERVEFYGIHRADLLQMLVDRLPPDGIETGHRCVGFEQDEERAVVDFEHGARVEADVVVGADGIHSALQRYVNEPKAPLHSGSIAYRGVIAAESVGWPTEFEHVLSIADLCRGGFAAGQLRPAKRGTSLGCDRVSVLSGERWGPASAVQPASGRRAAHLGSSLESTHGGLGVTLSRLPREYLPYEPVRLKPR
jgi:2-polyprenyl-6-methoxyphenol hydroxylase-like FAD-dependent oxidoreductase